MISFCFFLRKFQVPLPFYLCQLKGSDNKPSRPFPRLLFKTPTEDKRLRHIIPKNNARHADLIKTLRLREFSYVAVSTKRFFFLYKYIF